MIVLKILQGSIRFYYLGGDIAGFLPSLKCILGFESVVDAIPNAAERMQGSWTKFFTRTSKQTLQMQEREPFIGSEMIVEKENSKFSTFERMMGHNMVELIGTVAGLALAAASIVMIAIDLANEKEVIQILSVVAGWITLAGAAAEAGIMATLASYSVVSMCATWGGPLAIAFAVIGIIIFMIWYFSQDHRDPTQKFLDDQVQPAGLGMPGDKQAPEYFEVIPVAANNPSLVRLAIRGPLVSVKEYTTHPSEGERIFPETQFKSEPLKIPDAQQLFISLDVDAKVPSLATKIDFSMNTIWSLETDPDGKSFIYTAAFTQKADEAGKAAGITRKLTQIVYRELPTEQSDKRILCFHMCSGRLMFLQNQFKTYQMS
ncbi:hypothetical protein IL306_007408 [Fusarium sp. DS 682]|nr:hypothetical protein IL306_007408 [Fusarium sp. DS 682]